MAISCDSKSFLLFPPFCGVVPDSVDVLCCCRWIVCACMCVCLSVCLCVCICHCVGVCCCGYVTVCECVLHSCMRTFMRSFVCLCSVRAYSNLNMCVRARMHTFVCVCVCSSVQAGDYD